MKCDLHIHSHYSYDSTASVKDIVDSAVKKGIDCIAITDHNEIKASFEAMEYAKGKPILIIPAIEVKSKDGDVIALNVKEKIEKNLPAEQTIEKIKEQGGMAVIAHPFGDWHGFKKDMEDFIGKIDAVEVLNASVFFGNKEAKQLVEKYNLPFTAGSDAHEAKFIGSVYLEIPGNNLSIGQILEAIKNKNCQAKGEELPLSAKIIERTKRGLIRISKLFK